MAHFFCLFRFKAYFCSINQHFYVMKHIFILIAIISAFNLLNAQETYCFRTDAPQGLHIESSTNTGLSLHYVLNKITIADYNNGDTKGQEIIMKGSFGSFAEGLPNLPFENRYIAVPKGAKVSVKVRENGCQTLKGINLLPAAKVMLNRDSGLPKLRKNMNVFGKDANFPAENVTIAQTTQIRGLDVIMLNVTPFRYNPVRKTLEVLYDMDIEVCFEGGDGQFGDARYRNPDWDHLLRDLVMNSDMLPESHYYERLNDAIQNREEGCEYLIITLDDPTYMAWADTLKQFRSKQGILTKVVTTTDCGGNEPEDIRNYILNAYNNWAIPPAAVLLFGSNHKTTPNVGLKPFLHTIEDVYYIDQFPTDHPFADMNGDSIPDLVISRIPANKAKDCPKWVKKCIDYELNPPTDPHYYDHPVLSSGYQEDKWFMITSQSVNSYFCNKLGKHPSNLYMKYYSEDNNPTPPDSIWSIAPNTEAVMDYFGPNGAQYIPSSIGGLNDWFDMQYCQRLVNAINEECFLIFYRDHSGQDTWCCPYFTTSHLDFLTNEKPTFTFSIGCLTNNFWDNWSVCLTETMGKMESGTLGAIGANSATYSHFNDILAWGTFDYLWPDFMPTLGSQTHPNKMLPSYALTAGKLFLRQQTFLSYSLNDTIQRKIDKTLNLFSYLGETYLNLYTEVPQPLTIEAPSCEINNQHQYTFTAEEGATICLSLNNEIIAVTQATGQTQSLTLPIMAVGKELVLTATKQNRFRFEQTVSVISSEYPYIHLSFTDFHDQDNNGQLDFGEYVDMDINLANTGQPTTETGEVTLLCNSPYIEILKGTADYPPMESGAICMLKDAFRIKLSNNVPDQQDIALATHFEIGENTHDDIIHITPNAPKILISPEFHPMTEEGRPSTHISTNGKTHISFTIKNVGHAPAELLNSTLDIKAPFIESKPYQHKGLNPNEELSFTHELNALPKAVTGAWLQARLDMQYGEYHICLDTIIQYGGIFENFETDTLNTFFTWTNIGKWEYCTENAFEGLRCFISTSDSVMYSALKARLKKPYVGHNCKLSFYYMTGNNPLQFFTTNQNDAMSFSNTDWNYAEVLYNGNDYQFNWRYNIPDSNNSQAKIDNIWFPPLHTAIAYAGDDIVTCNEAPVELANSYAYDCDSILWVTEGDGHFDCDTIVNPVYFPGSQDLANSNVTLTLTAFGDNTIISSTQIHFVNDIELRAIVGDSIVNKYENPVSPYSIEGQEGLNYVWRLEPAEAGIIYSHGNTIDILWNLHEGDTEVTLSVTADNGCEIEPVTKHISLIGSSTSEWHSVDFDLFPNPTDGKINLVLSESLQSKAYIEVYNLLGERMMNKSIGYALKGETLSLDLSHLVSGLYIIRLSTENGSCSKKVSVW